MTYFWPIVTWLIAGPAFFAGIVFEDWHERRVERRHSARMQQAIRERVAEWRH